MAESLYEKTAGPECWGRPSRDDMAGWDATAQEYAGGAKQCLESQLLHHSVGGGVPRAEA